MDKFADKHGTRALATAYLEYLFSEPGQELAVRHHFRPRLVRVAERHKEKFPRLTLFTVDEVFGGWKQAQKAHFDDGAIFDQLYVVTK